jgi:hypothetical protein
VRLVKGDWNEAFLDELGNFPSGSHKDQVDALSGAFGRLLKRTAGIFSMPLDEITCEPFAIPAHWPRVYALDLDWQRVSAIWAACDSESQTVYLYSEYSARRAELAIHAEAIRSRGKDIRGFMNPTAHGRVREEGVQLIGELWKRDLSLMGSPHASKHDPSQRGRGCIDKPLWIAATATITAMRYAVEPGKEGTPQLASVIFPLPSQDLHLTGYILRPGRTGCITSGKPVPLQAGQMCSLIFGVISSLSCRLNGLQETAG